MIKYETNNVRWNDEARGDEFWVGANGGDLIKQIVNRPNDYWNNSNERIGIEQKLDRLMEAVGRIADKTGINLLEVFAEDDLQVQYRLQTGE
jgi:DnaJ-class molecular chaperone